MTNTIIIPAIGRPGFLAITLGLIAANPGWRNHHFMFALDLGHHTGLHQVIKNFDELYDIDYQIIEPPKRYPKLGKQSFNIINAYREAVKLGSPYIHLIEDDIFVANDFFKWHYAVQAASPHVGISIGTRNNNQKDLRRTHNLEAYYIRHDSYQSLGVCWSLETLKFVLGHIQDWYFENPVEYCAARFPDSKIGRHFAEQDGLIRRILEVYEMPVIFPHVPRAYHAGFEGYNRHGKETLPESLGEQIEMIRRIAFSPETMRANTYHPEQYADSVPVPLRNPEWQTQKLVSLSR